MVSPPHKSLPALILALGLLLAVAAPAPADKAPGPLREAVLAGSWYPAEAAALAASVDGHLAGTPARLPGRLVALVTPHAGHFYSGSLAGRAWAAAGAQTPRPQTVVLVGPSHRFPLARPSLWLGGAYATPLGQVMVDQDLAARLTRELGAELMPRAHLREHCLEIQLPFIQRALPQARIVTILTGPPDLAAARRLGTALAGAAKGGGVLLAASSDLSHFHPQARAQELDARVAARVKALDPEGLLQEGRAGRLEACGLQALAAVLFAARELGAKEGRILDQATSARASGRSDRVVGYMAAALTLPPEGAKGGAPGGAATAARLTEAEQAAVRDLARRAVAAAVRGQALPAPPAGPPFDRPAGAFVTIKRGGELRGCIGLMQARQPLGRTVVAMARAAALEDPRFPPVRPEELAELAVEVSILTPMAPCQPAEVEVGRDGLMIVHQGRRGVLLPQVPLEQGWGREEYLDGLCRKAGLPPGAWRQPGSRLYCFQAQVF